MKSVTVEFYRKRREIKCLSVRSAFACILVHTCRRLVESWARSPRGRLLTYYTAVQSGDVQKLFRIVPRHRSRRWPYTTFCRENGGKPPVDRYSSQTTRPSRRCGKQARCVLGSCGGSQAGKTNATPAHDSSIEFLRCAGWLIKPLRMLSFNWLTAAVRQTVMGQTAE